MTPQEANALNKAVNERFGRWQGPELFYSANVDLNTPQTVMLPRPLNLTRPMTDLYIRVRGRLTTTVANAVQVSPEALYNVLQNVKLTGTHRVHNQLTPIDMSGATIYAWPFMFGRSGGSQVINNSETAAPGRPQTSGWLGTTAASPYDFEIVYWIPTNPLVGGGPSAIAKRDKLNYAYMPGDWGDSLQLQLTFGDETSFGDLTGGTNAFTAFGSATGLPTFEIHCNYTIFSPELVAFKQAEGMGVCVRQERTLTGFTAATLNTRLMQLQKYITPNIVVKSGIQETTAQTAGIFTYETLSDLILDKTQMVIDNSPIRNNQANIVQKAYLQDAFGSVIPQGYTLLSFVEGGRSSLAYRGDKVAPGADFALNSDITASVAANHVIRVTQEMIYGGPFEGVRR